MVRDLISPTAYPDYAKDVDNDALGLAITGVDNANGSWEFSLNGSSWSSLAPSAPYVVTLYADDSTRVRFVPNANYNGSASITYRLWDRTSYANGYPNTFANGSTNYVQGNENGGVYPFSADTDTATIGITAVNDAPTLSNTDYYVTTDEDVPVTFNPFTSAAPFDADGNSLYISGVAGPATFDPYGNITYAPASNANGSDTVTPTVKGTPPPRRCTSRSTPSTTRRRRPMTTTPST